MLNTFLAKILLKFRIASPLWYTILAAILVGFKYVLDSGVVAVPSDVSNWVLFLLSLLVSPGLSKYAPKVMMILLLAVPSIMWGQAFNFTQANGQPITITYAKIVRCERHTVTHDTRVYTSSSTYVVSSMNIDSVRDMTDGHLVSFTQTTTWKPYLTSPSQIASITRTSGSKAIVKIGSTSYTTTNSYDSLTTVVASLGSTASYAPLYLRYMCSLNQFSTMNPFVTVGENSLGMGSTITRADTGVFLLPYPAAYSGPSFTNAPIFVGVSLHSVTVGSGKTVSWRYGNSDSGTSGNLVFEVRDQNGEKTDNWSASIIVDWYPPN